ncbi:hypothetical protein [Kaistella palustris]|uniref:hypothetical protein n=1 Tax=Kaistella palustris TaxID=493376 RepID=UPI00042975F3|nr:hypothetical protein [Kaistella palustris]
MENESGWNSLKLEKQELEDLYLTAKNANENLPAEILSIDYDEKGIDGIELEYTFVHLKRSWFNKNVMLSDYFEWKEAKPISDGETISDSYKLPAFPKTMMLIKNLKIILDSSVSDTDVNAPNSLIFFGPLVMKQQLFVNQNSKERFLKVVTDKRTLQSDQFSYLAKKTAPQTISIQRPPVLRSRVFESTSGDPVKPGVTTVTMDRMKMGTVLSSRPIILSALHPAEPVKPLSPKTEVPPMRPPRPIVITETKLPQGIFIPILLPLPQSVANVTFRISDSKNSEPVYKCSISLIGTNSNNEMNRIYNIESDRNGTVSQNLPVGEYKISLRADEYAVVDGTLSVPNTNPIIREYKLQRGEIKFKSFFLIGMVCEKMPRIPFV